MTEPPPQAYALDIPPAVSVPLVYSSPHSGRYYPSHFLAATKLGKTAIRRSEDAFVDILLVQSNALKVPLIKANFARAYLDLNRDPKELDASMFIETISPEDVRRTARVIAGLGAVARIVGDGQEIYGRKIPASEAVDRIENVYVPYHRALNALLGRTCEDFGYCVLLDWHSMPSGASSEKADVVLGDRFGTSCSGLLVNFVETALSSLGLRTQRNVPFAGGYTTEFYGRPAQGVHTLQIEIDRSLYLDEATLTLLPAAESLATKIAALTLQLQNALKGHLGAMIREDFRQSLAGE